MQPQESTNPINDILEIVRFIKDNAVTKEDLKDFATKEDLKAFATKEDLGKLKHELLDNMDRKLQKHHGDLVLIMRKEDVKLRELISILREKSVLTPSEAIHILSMDPFPELRV